MNTADIRKIFRTHARPGEFLNMIHTPLEGTTTIIVSNAQGNATVTVSEEELVQAVAPEYVINARIVHALQQLRGDEPEVPTKQTFYASLVRGLSGYYVKFQAPNEEVVREHLAEYFGRMWCSVYTLDRMAELVLKFKCDVINEDTPIVLETAEWE